MTNSSFSTTAAVILAAGQGTRMRSRQAKVLHPILGRPLVHYPVLLAKALGLKQTVVVVGHAREQVEASVLQADPEARFAVQAQQRGTGDAVKAAEAATRDVEHVLILSGDVPALSVETVRAMAAARAELGAPLCALGFAPDDMTGYGRLVTGDDGRLLRIVEDRDANPAEKAVRVANSGIYLVERAFLFEALARVDDSNAQGEFYLTDIAQIAAESGQAGAVVSVADPFEVGGVNDRTQLASLTARFSSERNAALMRSGVTMQDPSRVLVEWEVSLGQDVTLHPDVALRGRTSVSDGVTIMQGSVLTDVSVAEDAVIKPYCVLEEATVGPRAAVGPFAHLRPGSALAEDTKVGNFVETKKVSLGPGSKASHLTYLGDATIGRDVNIGAGTITCNYDGVEKHQTVLEDRVFIGSNTELVAPVTVGEEALVGAGTTVTQDVPAGALAVSRTPQRNVDRWSRVRGPHARKRAKQKES